MCASGAAQIVVISVKAFRRFALGALDLGPFQVGPKLGQHAGCYLVLQIEDIVESTVQAIGPQVGAVRRIDELGRDAYPSRRLPHAALEHITNSEIPSNLLHVDVASLVSK